MAFGAHVVPVLAGARPVQHVAMIDALLGIEVEPALSAALPRPAVPGQGKRLQPAVGKLDQVLLQRVDAEGVLDFEVGQLPLSPVSIDEEPAVAAQEGRSDAGVREARAVEAAQHGLVIGVLHGLIVLRSRPLLLLFGVTLGARARANERQGRLHDGCARFLMRTPKPGTGYKESDEQHASAPPDERQRARCARPRGCCFVRARPDAFLRRLLRWDLCLALASPLAFAQSKPL